ncbi:MAG: rhodanese-like domain-containing protein [Bacteroidetes bacterium]|nr:rhodanese-like domain-containing protein [Bacteroidota bacterium]
MLFKNLFGKPADFKSIYRNGAIILDVRTSGEFRTGHIEGALNIPLDRLGESCSDLKKQDKPVIACCQSGGRSAAALRLLNQAGIQAYNGGGWQTLQRALR